VDELQGGVVVWKSGRVVEEWQGIGVTGWKSDTSVAEGEEWQGGGVAA
jgi:hypothetical protein